ncbi:uncharacterized protein METZ01_LOCUS216113, partial [marine metagenome]
YRKLSDESDYGEHDEMFQAFRNFYTNVVFINHLLSISKLYLRMEVGIRKNLVFS